MIVARQFFPPIHDADSFGAAETEFVIDELEAYLQNHKSVEWATGPIQGPSGANRAGYVQRFQIRYSASTSGFQSTEPRRSAALYLRTQDAIATIVRQQIEIQNLRNRLARAQSTIKDREKRLANLSTMHARKKQSFAEAFASLDELAHLGPNWDSYGAEPPSAPAIGRASRLLSIILGRHSDEFDDRLRPWAIAPFSGGLQMEWRTPAGTLEIEVSPSGELGLLKETPSPEGLRFEEVDNISLQTAVDEIIDYLSS